MAWQSRSSKLETRTARSKLPISEHREPYWVSVRPALQLGYYKGKKGGAWVVRYRPDGETRYYKHKLGSADDTQDSNGLDVLDYGQAQRAAMNYADNFARQEAGQSLAPYTVADAIRDYLEGFEGKSLSETARVCERYILPALGSVRLDRITKKRIQDWHRGLAKAAPMLRTGRDADRPNIRTISEQRPRQATANRILTVLKAALNRAWENGKVQDADPWRAVKPFKNVDACREQYLSEIEAQRLINACPEDFRQLASAALLSGCRYGELIQMQVKDCHPDSKTIHVRESKSGKPRDVPLTDRGTALFERACVGKKRTDNIFMRADGQPWGRSHQTRLMREACQQAGIDPPISFHGLRHAYAASLARAGVPLQVIAAALGHSDTRMTEKHYAHLQPSFVADTVRANLPDFGTEVDNVMPIKKVSFLQ